MHHKNFFFFASFLLLIISSSSLFADLNSDTDYTQNIVVENPEVTTLEDGSKVVYCVKDNHYDASGSKFPYFVAEGGRSLSYKNDFWYLSLQSDITGYKQNKYSLNLNSNNICQFTLQSEHTSLDTTDFYKSHTLQFNSSDSSLQQYSLGGERRAVPILVHDENEDLQYILGGENIYGTSVKSMVNIAGTENIQFYFGDKFYDFRYQMCNYDFESSTYVPNYYKNICNSLHQEMVPDNRTSSMIPQEIDSNERTPFLISKKTYQNTPLSQIIGDGASIENAILQGEKLYIFINKSDTLYYYTFTHITEENKTSTNHFKLDDTFISNSSGDFPITKQHDPLDILGVDITQYASPKALKNSDNNPISVRYDFDLKIIDEKIIINGGSNTDVYAFSTEAESEAAQTTEELFDDIFVFRLSKSILTLEKQIQAPEKTKNIILIKNNAGRFFLIGGGLENKFYYTDALEENTEWTQVLFQSSEAASTEQTEAQINFQAGIPNIFEPITNGQTLQFAPYQTDESYYTFPQNIQLVSDLQQLQWLATRVCKKRWGAYPCGYSWLRITGTTNIPIHIIHSKAQQTNDALSKRKEFQSTAIKMQINPLQSFHNDNEISFTGFIQAQPALTATPQIDLRLHSLFFVEDTSTSNENLNLQDGSEQEFHGFDKNFFNQIFKISPTDIHESLGTITDGGQTYKQSKVQVNAGGEKEVRTLYKFDNDGNFITTTKTEALVSGAPNATCKPNQNPNNVCNYSQFARFIFQYDLPTENHALIYSNNASAELITMDQETVTEGNFLWKQKFSPGHHRIHVLATATHSRSVLEYKARTNLWKGLNGDRLISIVGPHRRYFTPDQAGLDPQRIAPGPFQVYYQAYVIDFVVPEINSLSSDQTQPTIISSIKPVFNLDKGLSDNRADFFMGDNIEIQSNQLATTHPLYSATDIKTIPLTLQSPLNDSPLNVQRIPQNNFWDTQINQIYTPQAHYNRTNQNGETEFQAQSRFLPLNDVQKTSLQANHISGDYYKFFSVISDEHGNKIGTPPVYVQVQEDAKLHIYSVNNNVVKGAWKKLQALKISSSTAIKYVRADADGNFEILLEAGTWNFSSILEDKIEMPISNFTVGKNTIQQNNLVITNTVNTAPIISNYKSGDVIFTSQPIIEGKAEANTSVYWRAYFKPLKKLDKDGFTTGTKDYRTENNNMLQILSSGQTYSENNGYFSFILDTYLTGAENNLYYIEVSNTEQNTATWTHNNIISLGVQKTSAQQLTNTATALMGSGASFSNKEKYLEYQPRNGNNAAKYIFGLYSATDEKSSQVNFPKAVHVKLKKGQILHLPAFGEMTIIKTDATNSALFYLREATTLITEDQKLPQRIDQEGLFLRLGKEGQTSTGLLEGDKIMAPQEGTKILILSEEVEITTSAGTTVEVRETTTGTNPNPWQLEMILSTGFENSQFSFEGVEETYQSNCVNNGEFTTSNYTVNTVEQCKIIASVLYPQTQNPTISFPRIAEVLDKTKKIEIFGFAFPNTTLNIFINNKHKGTVNTDRNGRFYWITPEIYEFQNTADPIDLSIYDTEQESQRVSRILTFATTPSETTSINNTKTQFLAQMNKDENLDGFTESNTKQSIFGKIKNYLRNFVSW